MDLSTQTVSNNSSRTSSSVNSNDVSKNNGNDFMHPHLTTISKKYFNKFIELRKNFEKFFEKFFEKIEKRKSENIKRAFRIKIIIHNF